MLTDPLLQPLQLRHLRLRNRIFSSSHAPAFAEQGHPRDRYRLYHEEKAKGGVALTMIGGSTNIAPDSPSVFGQLYAGDDSIIPWFVRLTDGVKSHGAAVMCQITHMGRRTTADAGHWLPVLGVSHKRERAHRSFPKVMEDYDFKRVIENFADAVWRCQQGGFDGVELLSHAHLLGQFLSPALNDRGDQYGGTLQNRVRFTLEVLSAIRQRVGNEFIIGIRLTGDEFDALGITMQEAIATVQILEASGYVDFINILMGSAYDDLGLASWVSPMGYATPDNVTMVAELKAATSLPVFYAGGIADITRARQAVRQGQVDMIGMTRAQIADPHLLNKLLDQREQDIRPCVGLGYCVDRVNQGKDAVCGHNAASGRESQLSHGFDKQALVGKKAVVVGGGPAGMEAARVLAERGMSVVLFEASSQLGGQLILAAQAPLRRQISGVTHWLHEQLQRLEVDICYNCYAEQAEILAEQAQLVIIASGGLPMPLDIAGAELALSSWDILAGASCTGEVLVFDEPGDQQAGVVADYLASNGCQVTHVSPDRASFMELGPTNSAVVLRNLYHHGVEFIVNHDLLEMTRQGDKVQATLSNTLTQVTRQLNVDHVVVENGTMPMQEVYLDLKTLSRNGGEYDQRALIAGKLILPVNNLAGGFDLLRIGDAVSSGNLHGAVYAATRMASFYAPL